MSFGLRSLHAPLQHSENSLDLDGLPCFFFVSYPTSLHLFRRRKGKSLIFCRVTRGGKGEWSVGRGGVHERGDKGSIQKFNMW